MKTATIEITDIKEKDGLYIVATKVKAGRNTFTKAIAVRPHLGEVSVKDFKTKLREVILKELAHRRAIEPIKHLSKGSFTVEYDEPNRKDTKS